MDIEQVKRLLENTPGWFLLGEKIAKQFTFKDFKASLRFVLKVGELAEQANHHPEIRIEYNKVTLELISHEINALTEKDFDLAQKINQLL